MSSFTPITISSASKRGKKMAKSCFPPKPSSIMRRFRTVLPISRPDRHALHAPVGTHLNSATFSCPFWPPRHTCAAEISTLEGTFQSTLARFVRSLSRWTSPLRRRQELLPSLSAPTRLNLFGVQWWRPAASILDCTFILQVQN